MMEQILFTIGHSNHDTGYFMSLLAQHGITAVVDVRSNPYSRFCPQFNREVLHQSLESNGIAYMYFGEEFGARRIERECYIGDQANYDLISKTSTFIKGVTRLLREIQHHCIALMCSEKDPITCHRTILVVRALKKSQLRIEHILCDGSTETNEEAETRLLSLVGLPDEDLFLSRIELVDDAYNRQSERIAFKDNSLSNS